MVNTLSHGYRKYWEIFLFADSHSCIHGVLMLSRIYRNLTDKIRSSAYAIYLTTLVYLSSIYTGRYLALLSAAVSTKCALRYTS